MKRQTIIALGVAAVALLIAALLVWPALARAADKGGGELALPELPAPTADNPWTGCWIGGGVGHTIAELSGGGPIGMSANGQHAAAHAGCRVQAGIFVGGLEGSYAFMFGDLDTLGIDRELAVTGTFGVVPIPRAQLYGHVSWSRIKTQFGDFDGWKFGPGIALQVPKSPMEIDLRAAYGTWDVGIPGADANAYTFMAIAKYRFGGK